MKREDVAASVMSVLAPFNKTGVSVTESTRFAADLNFDSLVVMEFVAAIEDEFDISVPMNILPDIETVGQLIDAVARIVEEEHG